MRQASVRVFYDNVDISADITPFLIGFRYTDQAHGKQDTLSITLHDKDGRWRTAWFPEKGAALHARIEVTDWHFSGDDRVLDCGTFEISGVSLRGKPWTLEIQADAVPVNAELRNMKKTRAWQGTSLAAILGRIASENGMKSFFDAKYDPVHQRLDQRSETDAQFLTRIAGENGLCFKASAAKLVLYDLLDYEARDSAFAVALDSGNVTGFSFNAKSDDTYDSCAVSYWDAAKQQLLTYTYKPAEETKKAKAVDTRPYE